MVSNSGYKDVTLEDRIADEKDDELANESDIEERHVTQTLRPGHP